MHHLVDGVDGIDAFALGAVALMHRVDAQIAGLAAGIRLSALADRNRRGPGLDVA